MESEFEIHKAIATDYIKSHPYTLLSSTPDMTSASSRRKAVEKGYQRGFPDIFKADPRVYTKKVGRKLHIRFCPGVFDEVKTPSVSPYVDSRGRKKPGRRGGQLSSSQRSVRDAVRSRGYLFTVPRSVEDAKVSTALYEKNWKTLYDGTIVVDLRTGDVELPRKPTNRIVLPRTKPKKQKTKARKKRVSKKRPRSSRNRGGPKRKRRRLTRRK